MDASTLITYHSNGGVYFNAMFELGTSTLLANSTTSTNALQLLEVFFLEDFGASKF